MRSRTWAFWGLFVVWASLASAQPWKEAYDREDYPTAASLLQGVVFEHSSEDSRYPDVLAIQTLAHLYAEGRGVPRDTVMACTLANFGSGAAVYRHGDRDPRTIAVHRQVEAYCVPLTTDERREAMRPDGCLLQGPEPRVLFVSATRRVDLGRSGLTVVEGDDSHEYPLAPFVRCAQQIPLVRYIRVPAPKGSRLPAREFVQMYMWHSIVKDGRKLRTLEWSAIELTPRSMALRARTVLEQAEGSAWPARAVPAEFSRGVAFTMHRSGDVRWQMNGRRSLQGVIARPASMRASATTPNR